MAGILGASFPTQFNEAADLSADALAVARAQNVALARSARDLLAHRGPDFRGDWYDERLYLGHAELAAAEATVAGQQPLYAADSSLVVAFDGALTNAAELRAALAGDQPFRGNASAELILHGYRRWGLRGMLTRLRGSFALALYDRDAARVILARDPLGGKPLYYRHHGTDVQFASELKGVTQLLSATESAFDYTAVYDFLTYRYIPAPKSLYREVRKLAAGEYFSMSLHSGHSALERYWQAPEPQGLREELSESDFVERCSELIHRAVTERLYGQREVFGLIDQQPGFADWLHTEFPRVTQPEFGLHPVEPPPAALATLLSDARRWFDEPFAAADAPGQVQLLAGLPTSAGVAISDVGADVLFGQANRFQSSLGRGPVQGSMNWIKHRVAGAPDQASRSVDEVLSAYTVARGGVPAADKVALREAWEIPADYDDYWAYREHYKGNLPSTARFQQMELATYVPEFLLTQLDRQAMRLGIEARAALLDQDLVEWVLAAPDRFRAPQLDLGAALFPLATPERRPLLRRLGRRLRGALRPTGVGAGQLLDPFTLLRQQFPELSLPESTARGS